MPPLRDFLGRFRPAGSPGAAAGVPVDRSGELPAEVTPVLALLDDTEAARQRLIARARADAAQLVAAARSEAAAIAADAAQQAEAIRQQAAERVLATARRQASAAVTEAAQQAAQTHELARQRLPALVGEATDMIRQLPAGEP